MKVDNVRIIVFIKIDKMMFYENLVFFWNYYENFVGSDFS